MDAAWSTGCVASVGRMVVVWMVLLDVSPMDWKRSTRPWNGVRIVFGFVAPPLHFR
jgi:hypothetical protein